MARSTNIHSPMQAPALNFPTAEQHRAPCTDRKEHHGQKRAAWTELNRTVQNRTKQNTITRTEPFTRRTGHHRQNRIRQNRTQPHAQTKTIHTDRTEHHRQNIIRQNRTQSHGQIRTILTDRTPQTEQNRTEQQNARSRTKLDRRTVSNRTDHNHTDRAESATTAESTEQNTITRTECTMAHTHTRLHDESLKRRRWSWYEEGTCTNATSMCHLARRGLGGVHEHHVVDDPAREKKPNEGDGPRVKANSE